MMLSSKIPGFLLFLFRFHFTFWNFVNFFFFVGMSQFEDLHYLRTSLATEMTDEQVCIVLCCVSCCVVLCCVVLCCVVLCCVVLCCVVLCCVVLCCVVLCCVVLCCVVLCCVVLCVLSASIFVVYVAVDVVFSLKQYYSSKS